MRITLPEKHYPINNFGITAKRHFSTVISDRNYQHLERAFDDSD